MIPAVLSTHKYCKSIIVYIDVVVLVFTNMIME